MGIACTGELTQSIEGHLLCSGEWVQEPDQLAQLYELLNAVFSTPETSSIIGAFMAAFSVPMIAYLVAWAYGKVVHFAESEIND